MDFTNLHTQRGPTRRTNRVSFMSVELAVSTSTPSGLPDEEISRALRELDAFFTVKSSTKKRKKSKARKSNGTGFGGQMNDSTGLKANVAKAAQEQEAGDEILQTAVEKLRKWTPKATQSFKLLTKLQSSSGWCNLCFQLLRNDSFFDVGARAKLYRPFLGLIHQLARHPSTMEFLSHPLHEEEDHEDNENEEGDGLRENEFVPTCKQLLTSLGSQARVYRQLQVRGKDNKKRKRYDEVMIIEMDESIVMADLIIETEKAVNSFVDLTSETSSRSKPKSADVYDLTGDDDMVMWVSGSSSGGTHSECHGIPLTSNNNKQPRLSEGSIVSSQYLEAQYVKFMSPHRFAVVDMCAMITSGTARHLFSNKPIGTVANMKSRMNRIAKEMATLSTALPVEYGSSILVRVDESRMDLAKALIIGPEGTPYENGCFEFDIQLPASYPQAPPAMLLATTGNGTVRFNPNLYNCGKVCLSLLGTWTGPGWDPQHSTLLQVLISIQALILVPDPFFNEPGFERYGAMCSESLKYSENIRKQCMRFAILEQLKTPSPLFADAIRTHFHNKREAVRRQMEVWGKDSSAHKATAGAVIAALDALQ